MPATASIPTNCSSILRQAVGWPPALVEALFGYTIGSADADLSFDERDSAPFVPKSKVIDPAFTWAERPPVRVPWDRTVIYEAHLRGLSMRHPQVPEAVRGTFAGLMNADLLAHIRRLGVTSVELLPILASSTTSTCWKTA